MSYSFNIAEQKDPFVAIASVIVGVTLMFAPSQVWVLVPISWSMILLEIVLVYFLGRLRR